VDVVVFAPADSCGRTAFVGDGVRLPFRDAAEAPRDVDRRTVEAKEESMPQGTVRWFNRIKGIGFLSVDGGQPDVFVHFSAVEADESRSLDEERRVEFDIVQGERSRQAARVRYI
jgi:cold shock protein